jgi:UDP-glucose 4-epimerase
MTERDHVLVIGGGGFLGTTLCNSLARLGMPVEALGRTANSDLAPHVRWTRADLSDPAALRPALARNDVVVHLAGGLLPARADEAPLTDLERSLAASLRLLELAAELGPKRVIFASSGGMIYGGVTDIPTPETAPTLPTGIYGIHKLTIERYLAYFERRTGQPHIVLRVANPYGPLQSARKGQGLVAALIERASTGAPVEIFGDGSVVRDYVFSEDVAAAFVAAVSYRGAHRIFNVGSGEGRSVAEVVNEVEAVMGVPIVRRYREGRPVDHPVSVLKCRLIEREMGWSPAVAWHDGLAHTVAWFESRRASDTR